MTTPDSAPAAHGGAPGESVPVEPAPADGAPTERRPLGQAAPAGGGLLPEQSHEDTDAAWGEYPERADDRLYRDRPPHWADF